MRTGPNRCLCGFYPAFDCLLPVEFGVVCRRVGSKTYILRDEQVDGIAEGLTMLRDTMCNGGLPVAVFA